MEKGYETWKAYSKIKNKDKKWYQFWKPSRILVSSEWVEQQMKLDKKFFNKYIK